jgi:hypothetical protein
VDRLIDATHRARIRTAEIQGRIRELRERNEWVAKEGFGAGSTAEQATRAARFAELARARASEAAGHSVTAHLHAAEAHERAANLFDELASAGDDGAFAQKASKHRAWAETEREAARMTETHEAAHGAAVQAAAPAVPPHAGQRRERAETVGADRHVADD